MVASLVAGRSMMSLTPPRLLVLLAVLLFGMASWAPLVTADAHPPYGATPGDAVVLEDAASCLDAVAERNGVQCTVLYGHVFDSLSVVPINAQRPPDEGTTTGGFHAPGYEPMFNMNQVSLYSVPTFVYYNAEDPDKKPHLFPTRGIARNITVPSDIPIVGHWFLSADLSAAPGSPRNDESGARAGIMPCVSVSMTLQSGRYFGNGTVLAAGQTTKHVVSAEGLPAGGVPGSPGAPCPGAAPDATMVTEQVTEFEVELQPVADPLVVPADEGFVVNVEWVQFDPTDDGTHRVYSHYTNFHASSEHRPRMVLPMQDAMVIEHVEAVPYEGKAYLRAHAMAALRVYDLDRGSLTAEVTDADGQIVETPTLHLQKVSAEMYHSGVARPAVAQWEWDPHSEGLAEGQYTLRLAAKNWQHTATAVEELPVVVGRDGSLVIGEVLIASEDVQEAGGVVPLVLVVMSGLLLVARGRDRANRLGRS